MILKNGRKTKSLLLLKKKEEARKKIHNTINDRRQTMALETVPLSSTDEKILSFHLSRCFALLCNEVFVIDIVVARNFTIKFSFANDNTKKCIAIEFFYIRKHYIDGTDTPVGGERDCEIKFALPSPRLIENIDEMK